VSETDESSAGPRPTVFLSYASADREAARLLKDAMPTFGLEVWYDESELGGGEAWDQKIRKQIRECDYFMPLVSAQTEARHEGYFRREWRLAVERTLDMADDHPFLLPVVIDDTVQTGARVPEKFFTIQWLRVPGGRPTPALEALCRRLASGAPVATAAAPVAASAKGMSKRRSQAVSAQYPQFPLEQPHQKVRFWFSVVGWALQSAWIFFKQLPRWIRILVSVWLSVVLLSKGCSSNHHQSRDTSAEAEKLRAISDTYHGSLEKGDIAKLATQIARIASDGDADTTPVERSPVLAIPFMAPAGDAAAAKMADATFALVYGKVAISHGGRVGLSPEAVSCSDLKAALAGGLTNHSLYVLCGTVSAAGPTQALTVKIASVTTGSVIWSKSYPVAGADPTQIAAEVDAQMPSLKVN
jgi:TIR domain